MEDIVVSTQIYLKYSKIFQNAIVQEFLQVSTNRKIVIQIFCNNSKLLKMKNANNSSEIIFLQSQAA